jgi:hypothetical protein
VGRPSKRDVVLRTYEGQRPLYVFSMKSYRSRKARWMCNPVEGRERAFKCRYRQLGSSCCFSSVVLVFFLCSGRCITSYSKARAAKHIGKARGRLQPRSERGNPTDLKAKERTSCSSGDLVRRHKPNEEGCQRLYGLLARDRMGHSSYLSCSIFCSIFGCLAVPVTATETMALASLWRKKGISGFSNADFHPVAAREMSR